MITPLEMNGAITRSQDYVSIKHSEDNQSNLHQSSIASSQEQKREESATYVVAKDNSDAPDTRHDAKDKGKNEYYNNRNNIKKKKSEEKVVNKSFSGFDMKI